MLLKIITVYYIYLFFDDYYSFFSDSLNQKKTPLRVFGKRKAWFISILQETLSFFIKGLLKLKITKLPFVEIIKYEGYGQGDIPFDLNDKIFLRKAKSKIVLVHGWLFRDAVNQKKHRSLLLNNWKPNLNFQETTDEYCNRYKKEHDVLIGVHIRAGDYKKFEGGKWFYTPNQYYDKMKELAALEVFRDKKIAFVICSNEKNISLPETDMFSVFNEERHFVEDLYLLAKCDYIIGPPSTFSIWASFYGDVPLLMMNDISINIDEKYFINNAIVYS